MKKWKDLEVYHNLEPEEIPTAFKKFALYISEKLSLEGFKLKASKTQKRFFRIIGDLEQAIYFDNSNRWASNQKEIRIYISIKPLFTKTPSDTFWIFQAFEIHPDFKMSYPLTIEYLLLADHLAERINKHIPPFFERNSSIDKILEGHQNLLNHYKIPSTGGTPLNIPAEKLVYECAFRARNKEVFNIYYQIYLQRIQRLCELYKDSPASVESSLNQIALLAGVKKTFDDDELYKLEIEQQNKRAVDYVASLTKK